VSHFWDSAGVRAAYFHPRARDVIRDFPEEVRRALGKAIYDLQLGHHLSMPLSRLMPTLGPGAAELRIRDTTGIYRAFYVVRTAQGVLVFHAFAKKTQKTPAHEIVLGQERLKEMLR
jgi:phage-related protein